MSNLRQQHAQKFLVSIDRALESYRGASSPGLEQFGPQHRQLWLPAPSPVNRRPDWWPSSFEQPVQPVMKTQPCIFELVNLSAVLNAFRHL